MKSSSELSDRRGRQIGLAGSTTIDIGLASIMVIVVFASGYLSLTRHDVAIPQSTGVVVVGAGQNLWSIAEENPVDGLDTAQTVDLIRLLNSKRGSGVQSGEVVIVPTASERR